EHAAVEDLAHGVRPGALLAELVVLEHPLGGLVVNLDVGQVGVGDALAAENVDLPSEFFGLLGDGLEGVRVGRGRRRGVRWGAGRQRGRETGRREGEAERLHDAPWGFGRGDASLTIPAPRAAGKSVPVAVLFL